MEHPDNRVTMSARTLIARLRQRVQAWLDSDRILPADGAGLLAALDHALGALGGDDAPAAQAGITAFMGQVQALVEARALAAEDGHPPIEVAAAMVASLYSADGTDG